jgi:membrane protein YqaA with SNARE-associated domain
MKASQFLSRIMQSRYLYSGVAAASALESTVVPVPFEILLIPVMQSHRSRIFYFSLMALFGCVLGALLGYLFGYALYETLGRWMVSITGTTEQFQRAVQMIRDGNGFWFVFSVGFTPVPFQIAMVAAGVSRYSFYGFIAATTLSRSIRYFGLGFLVLLYGDKAKKIYEKHKIAVSIAAFGIVLFFWFLSWYIL